LTVDVARLAKTGERLTGELDGAVLDLGDTAGLIEPAGVIRFDLSVEPIGSELLVRGSASAAVACVCSRCAGRFEIQIREPAFVASYPLDETTDSVDLTEDLREAIILLLPGYPVCREGCRGLCPRCGTNLNQASCRCQSEDADGRWNALDVISFSQGRTGGAQSGRGAGCDAGKRNHVNGSKRSVSNGGTETEEI
jgi:uncharacterized protein